ncbi:DUF1566 domain-containing protein [uncultured Campylobacter sp.]|jgi:hypothetical protein|uniref:Lcl C-terminal domain-containing protein n=1 Tax=uncultured Campylobacter sp. TaxID=218934 RepID=UPI002633E305|nr:DUF1566 domain-containing protein [uncultured Campylobacter sp.]
MKKICFALTLLLCCGSAFAFGSVAGEKGSGITAGFSRDDRLEVVKDDIYRLMWQDQQFMDSSATVFPLSAMGDKYNNPMTYDEAVEYCKNLTFAGFEDWRLPTINELLSITDDTRFKPAINKAFKNVAYETNDKGEKSYGWYWSSTRSTGGMSFGAWFVLFMDGNDSDWLNSSPRGFVRCVRDY